MDICLSLFKNCNLLACLKGVFLLTLYLKRLLIGVFTRLCKVTPKEARNFGLIEWDFNVNTEFCFILGYSRC